MLRRSGGFRRHCWMLSARLRLFSSLIVRGRTEAVIPEQSGATMVAPQMQCYTLACERNFSRIASWTMGSFGMTCYYSYI